MIWKIMHVIGALAVFVLGLGASVSVNDMSDTPVALAPPVAGPGLGSRLGLAISLAVSTADAEDRWSRTKRKRRKLQRDPAIEQSRESRENNLIGTTTAQLPADCAYDSLASVTQGTDIYTCGGMHYQRFEESGVVSYKGHAIGLDPKAVAKARARKAAADKKSREDARKKKQASRKAELPPGCYYDAQASALKGTDLYSCGGVFYQRYTEGGVSGYEPSKP